MTDAHQHQDTQTQPRKITVHVIYNGVTKDFEEQPQEAAQALAAKASVAFGTHQLVLYRPDGTEVDLHKSLSENGIVEGATLLLKPHVVRGGSR